MKLAKSLLLGSAATLAVVAGAQAADLPSKKAAPVNYVRICDAYGAGFFYIPGTDTCVKLGGYVRAEYQYVPGQSTLTYFTGAAPAGTDPFAANVATSQYSGAQSTTGYEVRGRIDVDARTPTALGTARTYVRIRLANTSGIRNTGIVNNGAYTLADNSSTGPTIESAMVQWAGFTFGVAPENYAMMPSFMYNANPWSGFPNGMKQIAYTATFGGGWSATIALEDMKDMNNNQVAFDRLNTAAVVVGNVRLDQAWGFAAIHGMIGNSSLAERNGFIQTPTGLTGIGQFGAATAFNGAAGAALATGQQTYGGWAIGGTVSFKLPMLAAGDQVWFTANYAKGMIGALVSTGGLSNVSSSAAEHRLMGGIVRVDQPLVPTALLPNGAFVADLTTGWNVGMAFTHYWAAQWRSNFTAGYVAMNPPTSTLTTVTTWGSGRMWEVAGSIIYSPAKDFDIGLEVQYANISSHLQNPTAAFLAAGSPGLKESNVSTKLRIERTF